MRAIGYPDPLLPDSLSSRARRNGEEPEKRASRARAGAPQAARSRCSDEIRTVMTAPRRMASRIANLDGPPADARLQAMRERHDRELPRGPAASAHTRRTGHMSDRLARWPIRIGYRGMRSDRLSGLSG